MSTKIAFLPLKGKLLVEVSDNIIVDWTFGKE